MPSPAAMPARLSTLPWSALSRLIRLRNQTGTLLLLWPTLWALVLASRGLPPLDLLLIFAAGSFLMRSAGVILNDLADRSFDRQVARTKTRPLASGEVSAAQALLVLAVLLLGAGALLLLLNPFVQRLAPVALLLAALYPFAKRWLSIPQAMLGLAFGWGAVMAWAAVRGRLELSTWLLFGATAAWALAYDTIYALQDQEDDRRIGVQSAAVLFGTSVWLAVGAALAAMLLLLGWAGWLGGIGWPYYGVLAAVGAFFAAQALRLREPIPPLQAFALFRAHVLAGAAIFLGFLAGYW